MNGFILLLQDHMLILPKLNVIRRAQIFNELNTSLTDTTQAFEEGRAFGNGHNVTLY